MDSRLRPMQISIGSAQILSVSVSVSGSLNGLLQPLLSHLPTGQPEILILQFIFGSSLIFYRMKGL